MISNDSSAGVAEHLNPIPAAMQRLPAILARTNSLWDRLEAIRRRIAGDAPDSNSGAGTTSQPRPVRSGLDGALEDFNDDVNVQLDRLEKTIAYFENTF